MSPKGILEKDCMSSAKQTVPNKKVLQEQYAVNCMQYERVINDLQQRIKRDLSKIELVPTIKASYPKALADCEQALNIEPESSQALKLKELIKAYITV